MSSPLRFVRGSVVERSTFSALNVRFQLSLTLVMTLKDTKCKLIYCFALSEIPFKLKTKLGTPEPSKPCARLLLAFSLLHACPYPTGSLELSHRKQKQRSSCKFNSMGIRSKLRDRLHRHKRDGQSTDADETASIMSDDSLTMTVVWCICACQRNNDK